MRPLTTILSAVMLAVMLSGCLARAAVDVVTLPVRAVGSGVDAVTTSQSEADEKRGREIRRREERLGKLDRSYRKHNERCARGDDQACTAARAEYAEIQDAMSGVPVERYRD